MEDNEQSPINKDILAKLEIMEKNMVKLQRTASGIQWSIYVILGGFVIGYVFL